MIAYTKSLLLGMILVSPRIDICFVLAFGPLVVSGVRFQVSGVSKKLKRSILNLDPQVLKFRIEKEANFITRVTPPNADTRHLTPNIQKEE